MPAWRVHCHSLMPGHRHQWPVIVIHLQCDVPQTNTITVIPSNVMRGEKNIGIARRQRGQGLHCLPVTHQLLYPPIIVSKLYRYNVNKSSEIKDSMPDVRVIYIHASLPDTRPARFDNIFINVLNSTHSLTDDHLHPNTTKPEANFQGLGHREHATPHYINHYGHHMHSVTCNITFCNKKQKK